MSFISVGERDLNYNFLIAIQVKKSKSSKCTGYAAKMKNQALSGLWPYSDYTHDIDPSLGGASG